MKPIIYHTGLTPPPSVDLAGFEICYYPVLKVEYETHNIPQDFSDILHADPIILLMSKNAVFGLDNWLTHFGLSADFFTNAEFWTVGAKTHACLNNILGIRSFYPDEMTGKGVLKVLSKQNNSKVLLISSHDPQQYFIEGLSSAGIIFFHFPVYKIHIIKSPEFSTYFQNIESNYIIITSPSSVNGILSSLALSDLSQLNTKIISIGPTTSTAICQQGGDVFHESEVQDINVLYNNLDSLGIESSHH
tara:strand:+ start:76 stop:816 length:741 start_codon:yes stop_codon:yes gene_type:complete